MLEGDSGRIPVPTSMRPEARPFLEFLLSSLVEPSGRRLRPEVSRARHLAQFPANEEFGAWVEPLRARALERFPEADWLALDWLRSPLQLGEALSSLVPLRNISTTRFWLLAAWAGRHPPTGAIASMAEALEQFLLTTDKRYLYEGAGGLLALADALHEQASAEERPALGRRFVNLLAAPRPAPRKRSLQQVFYADPVEPLATCLGERLLGHFLPVLSPDCLQPDLLDALLERYDLSAMPLNGAWSVALGQATNRAFQAMRQGEVRAYLRAMHGRCAGLEIFLQLSREANEGRELWTWFGPPGDMLRALQPPGPADLAQLHRVREESDQAMLTGALRAPGWLPLVEQARGWVGLTTVACWALRHRSRCGDDERLERFREDLAHGILPAVLSAWKQLPPAARQTLLTNRTATDLAGAALSWLKGGLEKRSQPRPLRRVRDILGAGLRPGMSRGPLLALTRDPNPKLASAAHLALEAGAQIQGQPVAEPLLEQRLLQALAGSPGPNR